MPVYCSDVVISIALRARRFGYALHGHDVKVRVCVKSRRVLDLSMLRRLVEEAASNYDHRPLWETLCLEDPLVEHLASAILVEVLERLDSPLLDAWVEAETPDGRIIVSGEEASREYWVKRECS